MATSTHAPTPLPTPAATIAADRRSVTFETGDGVTLNGTLFGQGGTTVIFATTSGDHQDSWFGMAEMAARAGYLALTFDFRFWTSPTQRDVALMNRADADLRAAVAFAREQGAPSVVLVGASLGGIAAAKIAAEVEPEAVVVIGAPMSHPDLIISVAADELQFAAPKLFIASQNDASVPASQTEAMHDAAAGPKAFYVYPGSAHGTDLFRTEHAQDLQQRLLAFIQANAPALP